mmetsp:Transcript_68131/g.221854  ORF Transcript_68131/g.221854 Transcript_68131/m.221854 type:complete len:295 (-) Transcript_68131:12-896(-)
MASLAPASAPCPSSSAAASRRPHWQASRSGVCPSPFLASIQEPLCKSAASALTAASSNRYCRSQVPMAFDNPGKDSSGVGCNFSNSNAESWATPSLPASCPARRKRNISRPKPLAMLRLTTCSAVSPSMLASEMQRARPSGVECSANSRAATVFRKCSASRMGHSRCALSGVACKISWMHSSCCPCKTPSPDSTCLCRPASSQCTAVLRVSSAAPPSKLPEVSRRLTCCKSPARSARRCRTARLGPAWATEARHPRRQPATRQLRRGDACEARGRGAWCRGSRIAGGEGVKAGG